MIIMSQLFREGEKNNASREKSKCLEKELEADKEPKCGHVVAF